MTESYHTPVAYLLSDHVMVGHGAEAESWALSDASVLLKQVATRPLTWVIAEYWVERHWIAIEGQPSSKPSALGEDLALVQSDGQWFQAVAALTESGLRWLMPFLQLPHTIAVIPESEWVLAGQTEGVYAWMGAEGAAYAAHWNGSVVCALGAWRQPHAQGFAKWAMRESVPTPQGLSPQLALDVPVAGEPH